MSTILTGFSEIQPRPIKNLKNFGSKITKPIFFFNLTLAALVTSPGPNFNLSNLNRVSNFSWKCQLSYEILFVSLKWNWEDFFQNGLNQPPSPPRIWLTKKPVCFRVKYILKPSHQDIHLFNLQPEKWFEGYPVKSTLFFQSGRST